MDDGKQMLSPDQIENHFDAWRGTLTAARQNKVDDKVVENRSASMDSIMRILKTVGVQMPGNTAEADQRGSAVGGEPAEADCASGHGHSASEEEEEEDGIDMSSALGLATSAKTKSVMKGKRGTKPQTHGAAEPSQRKRGGGDDSDQTETKGSRRRWQTVSGPCAHSQGVGVGAPPKHGRHGRTVRKVEDNLDSREGILHSSLQTPDRTRRREV